MAKNQQNVNLLGIIRVTAYCLLCRARHNRHTFASMLLQQGESLHYVKEQMGHASIQTTVDIYGHICPSGNRNAVNKLGIGLME